ncbi:MAG: hypothetical protein LJE65_03930 [Desulfobacteraceae bacterium]|nr:hypothetical protein [Desulfobacteraceae bacterium]
MEPKIPFPPMRFDDLSTYPLAERDSKVTVRDFGRTWKPGGGFAAFLDTLPRVLAGADIREVIEAVCTSVRGGHRVVMAMGAHVIKVGLNPLVIDWMERGILTAVAMNGAGIIHDMELAMAGKTSEDVAAGLGSGAFGMARETGRFLSKAVQDAKRSGCGLGEAVGQAILDQRLPLAEHSILAAGARLGIPVTVHVAMGTDILHIHPDFDPGAAGAASHRDFRILASVVAGLENGVYLNVGSAVVLPEVFLKVLTAVRNLGHTVRRFTAVNMDFIRHYRPHTNVVTRPTAEGGRGIHLTGHHEILFPLLAAGVIEALSADPGGATAG